MKPRRRPFAAICALAVLVLIVVHAVNRKAMSAQEYYVAILPDPSFATFIMATDSEREWMSSMFSNSEVSSEELERLAQESTPAKQLAPILNDVFRNMPAGYFQVPDVFAGVYPSGGFNARVLQTPAGGYLILVNYDLKKSLWEWAKLIVNVLSLQKGSGLQPDDKIDQIIVDFVKSTQEYADSGKVPAFPRYATDEKKIFVILLHIAAMRFIMAHEYAHILLGQVERAPTDVVGLLHSGDEQDRKDGCPTKELDADKLAVEIIMGPSSMMESHPEIQTLGIYYTLAIFEALDVIRSGGARDVTYPGLDARRKAMRTLLERNATAMQHPIVADVMNAIDYLVLHACANKPRWNALQAGGLRGHVAQEDTPSAESHSAQSSTGDVRGLLDARNRGTAARDAVFVSFMREFSRTRASDDWDGMRTLVSNSRRWADHVNVLLDHAMACSLKGVKCSDLPWSPDQELNASGFVELAMAILAAHQGKRNVKEAVLDGPVRSRVLLVWRMLYGTSFGVIGASDDSAPTQNAIKEAMDKTIASLRLAELLQDPVLMGFSTLAGAWAFERMGDKSRASSLRSSLGDRFEWPPIAKGTDGNYIIAYPLLDYSGNKIPVSLKEVLGK